MENFASYLANLPNTPLVEAIQSLYESYYGQWNFKSVQELRDFVDQKTYERFKLYSKDEVAKGNTPFGSLEAIKAIDMDTFLKSVGDKHYDIVDDMKNQRVDANYINNLSYDWFLCLYNMKVLGWDKPAMYESDERMGGSTWDDVERIHVYHADDPSMDMDIKLDSLWATRQKDSATRQDIIDRFVEDAQDFNRWLLSSKDGGAPITSAAIKFKGEPNEVSVEIP